MKSPLPQVIAALFAAGTVSLAAAQANQPANGAQADANARSSVSPSMNFVDEPIASASTTQGADGELVDGIVKALNADPSLKDAKITVQPDGGNLLLTGRALTGAQKQRATQIAMAQAGERKVVNVIQTDAS